ncbi:MAG: hypothetical protein C4329_09955 [Chitinophagaceae bacterium]
MNSKTAIYTGFEFEVEGFPAIAIINKDLKEFPEKSAYRYSVFIEIVPDSFNDIGHPAEAEYDYLHDVEKEIIDYLE